ncbi:hypothetical protein JTE90_026369 [Oedothorax gibbosus]|uniref:Uncharacterized protein n=1 Tax=Oedothorax gibbosus TaxID=931172 RepID=A0AAV6VGK3_9ARAC|nr:hypothetical protein JTE90_026369 [Oedothorax gibbosus]
MGEGPEYYVLVQKLLPKLTAVEFLKLALANLDVITIETEEALLLLDKVMYKTATISKDFKMHLLTPEIQEKFQQRMKQMKLDEDNFMKMLEPYENSKGPYVKPPVVPEPKPAPDISQRQYKPDIPEKVPVAPSTEKKQAAYGSSARTVEKREAPKRRARSSSSSSSSSSPEETEPSYQDKIAKLQNEIARLNATKSTEQRSQPPATKYSFSLKKPEMPPRSRQMYRPSPPEEESYFEKGGSSSRPREPRSERGDRDRDHREPEPFSPRRSSKESYSPPRGYRGGKGYRPPFSYKRGK